LCTVSLPQCTSCLIKKPIKADSGSAFMGFLNFVGN